MSFGVICADPAWEHKDKLPGPGRGAVKHYQNVMTVEEICDFPVPPTEPHAYLFLWRVSSMVEEAYRVVRAWGFVPKSEVVWIKKTVRGKRHFGMGRHVRGEHETCIVATKGRTKPLVRNVRSTFEAQTGRHSAKPEFFYREIVEKLARGPYCELFARNRRSGWVSFGNELKDEDKWAA